MTLIALNTIVLMMKVRKYTFLIICIYIFYLIKLPASIFIFPNFIILGGGGGGLYYFNGLVYKVHFFTITD